MIKKLKREKIENCKNISDTETIKYFSTFDLGCSAALISLGFELYSLNKENPHKVQFIFYRENDIENVVKDYWSDRLEVKARTFFNNIKMLKNRIYSE
jgi:hypothetical protein